MLLEWAELKVDVALVLIERDAGTEARGREGGDPGDEDVRMHKFESAKTHAVASFVFEWASRPAYCNKRLPREDYAAVHMIIFVLPSLRHWHTALYHKSDLAIDQLP